jgi:hypothetical protein
MFDPASGNYNTTGTTPPIKISKGGTELTVKPGETYFLVKIHGAQAVFTGPFWETGKQLIVTSQVTINHPLLGNEPKRAIQRRRAIKKNQAEQLGLATNLVDLIPAVMDRVRISIEFMVDKKNQLAALAGLINDNTFVSAISLAPGAAAVCKTIGGLAQKVIDTFLEPESRQPILQFEADFNLATGDLAEAYYVIVGTRDDNRPLPNPLPPLQVRGPELLANGKPVTEWSYLILDVGTAEVRTRELSREPWTERLDKVETIAMQVANNPFAGDIERRKSWEESFGLLRDCHALLLADPLYLPKEMKAIIQKAYQETREHIFPASASGLKAPSMFGAEARALLGVSSQKALLESVKAYSELLERGQKQLKQLGVLE